MLPGRLDVIDCSEVERPNVTQSSNVVPIVAEAPTYCRITHATERRVNGG